MPGLEGSSSWAGTTWQRQWQGSFTSHSGLAGSGPAFFACRDAPLWWISVYLPTTRVQSYKSAKAKSPLPKKARASPFPTQLQRSWGWSAWLGAAASSEVTWLLCSPLLSHCWCSQNGHGAPLARALVSVCFFHMQESLSAASSSQGIHTSTADTHSGPARHPRAKQPWNSSWLCPHLPLSTGQQQGADQQPQGQQEPGAVRGRVRSEGAAPCPTLQAAVQSILTCSLSQEESRSAASALSRLYSKGEPTHITGDIHTLGHWTDRLWKNVL